MISCVDMIINTLIKCLNYTEKCRGILFSGDKLYMQKYTKSLAKLLGDLTKI